MQKKPPSFYVITGKGIHSRHNDSGSMREFILEKADLFEKWKIQKDPTNEGRLKFERIRSRKRSQAN